MPEGEQAVSTPAEGGTQTGQSTTPPTANSPTTPPAPVPEKPKTGFDELPDHAKEIIKRQSEKARAEKDRADRLEKELQATRTTPPPKNDKYSSMSAEEREQVELFERLARKAGYKSADEVEQFVQDRLAQERQRDAQTAREAADRKELQEVLSEFNGEKMPKITEEEMLQYLEDAAKDPRRSFLINAPFKEIALYMKKEELRKIEVDRLIKEGGGPTPPDLASGSNAPKQPERRIPKANSFAELRKSLSKFG